MDVFSDILIFMLACFAFWCFYMIGKQRGYREAYDDLSKSVNGFRREWNSKDVWMQ